MGSVDRSIRLVVAALVVVLYFSGVLSGTVGIIALVIAAIFTLTTLVAFCPLYTVLGLNSCKVKEVN